MTTCPTIPSPTPESDSSAPDERAPTSRRSAVAALGGRGHDRAAGRAAGVRAGGPGAQQHRRHPAGERPPGRPGADPVRPQRARAAAALGHQHAGAARWASSARARRAARRRWPRPAAGPTSSASSPARSPAEGEGLTIRLRPERPADPGRDRARGGRGAARRRGRGDADRGRLGQRGTDRRVDLLRRRPRGGLVVDGQTLTGPYTITVIGPAATMQTALTIPGGVSDAVARDGGTVHRRRSRARCRSTALHPPEDAGVRPNPYRVGTVTRTR